MQYGGVRSVALGVKLVTTNRKQEQEKKRKINKKRNNTVGRRKKEASTKQIMTKIKETIRVTPDKSGIGIKRMEIKHEGETEEKERRK